MAHSVGVGLLRRPKTTPHTKHLPRIQCLFGQCEVVHQAGQNKPGIDYFNSRHYYDKENVRGFLQNVGKLREIRRQKENVEVRPKLTKFARDPGAPEPDDSHQVMSVLPAIPLDGVHTMIRRPLTTGDDTPRVDENDMEEWCLKPFSTVHHGYAGYRDEFPLLMTKFSAPEEKEIDIKEFHTKRQSIVVADYSHGVIALTGPDDEFQEFVDLFPEKHHFMEEKSDSEPSQTDLATHLQRLMDANAAAAAASSSKESLTSSGSVMSESSYERILEDYRQSNAAERRMTLSGLKSSNMASLRKSKAPPVWGRRTSLSPQVLPALVGKGGWTGGRRSSLVQGPMSLLNADKDSLYASCTRRPSLNTDWQRTSFAGPQEFNTANLLSVIEEAKSLYPVKSETSITDLVASHILDEEEESEEDDGGGSGLDRSERNLNKLEKFLEDLSSSDSDDD